MPITLLNGNIAIGNLDLLFGGSQNMIKGKVKVVPADTTNPYVDDIVFFERGSGTPITYMGIDYMIVRKENIMGKIT